jgi:hypothetical protein
MSILYKNYTYKTSNISFQIDVLNLARAGARVARLVYIIKTYFSHYIFVFAVELWKPQPLWQL